MNIVVFVVPAGVYEPVNDSNCVIYCLVVAQHGLHAKLTVLPFLFASDARILQNKHRESSRGNGDERISSTVSRKGKTSSECCIALSKSLLTTFYRVYGGLSLEPA